MRFLLDTHVFLWCLTDDSRLTNKFRTKILNAQEVFVSSASIWEAVIKIEIKKLQVSIEDLKNSIEASGFQELYITSEHALAVSMLPQIHNDPFDRMLIAQAITEPLIFITANTQLKKYSSLIEVVI